MWETEGGFPEEVPALMPRAGDPQLSEEEGSSNVTPFTIAEEFWGAGGWGGAWRKLPRKKYFVSSYWRLPGEPVWLCVPHDCSTWPQARGSGRPDSDFHLAFH